MYTSDKINKKKAFFTIWIILNVFLNVNAQIKNEYEAKSSFLLKITGFIEWPQTFLDKSSDFNIYILGEDPVEKVLVSKIKNSGLKIKNKNVVVKKIFSINEAKDCHILYISSNYENNLDYIIKRINKVPILTISDTEGFTKHGVMINMLYDLPINFEVNKTSAEASGLYISSILLANANNVVR